LHWGYAAWALAKNDTPVNAPVLLWLNQVVAMERPVEANNISYNGLGELAALLLKTHMLTTPAQKEGVERMLQSFREDDLLPMHKMANV